VIATFAGKALFGYRSMVMATLAICVIVAHFHNVIIGSVVFGAMAGYYYWFPKAFGFTLDRRWGIVSFWCWLIGFYLAFMPLYALGLLGMTRRMQHYADLSWQPYFDRRGGGRNRHSLRHHRDRRSARGQHPVAREPSRPHR
jgi:heme/copper-type cytochrome/quinol oxidase subunit 1